MSTLSRHRIYHESEEFLLNKCMVLRFTNQNPFFQSYDTIPPIQETSSNLNGLSVNVVEVARRMLILVLILFDDQHRRGFGTTDLLLNNDLLVDDRLHQLVRLVDGC